MRYKQLVTRKIEELKNIIRSQDAFISMARPQEELKFQIEKMHAKINEIEALINTEDETQF
jgi:uncharacterized protein YcgL (UPF0745 family)